MQVNGWLDYLPLWGLYVATVLVVLFSVEGGFRLGRYRRQRAEHEPESTVGAMVGATLGLLAFMLAFTFGMAASRFDTRRGLVLDEANAIGRTYLRAELLPEPHRTAIRNLLREYVDVRLEGVQQPGKLEQAVYRSEEVQGLLWSQAVALGKKNPGSLGAGLFIGSLNEVIDLHAKRVTAGLRSRIPGAIWAALYFVVILAMAVMGYHTGLIGTRSSLATLALVLTFSAVMLLIADLDRPKEGLLKVSQQAMVDLRNTLMAPSDEDGQKMRMSPSGARSFPDPRLEPG
jgi:hypothetical protein